VAAAWKQRALRMHPHPKKNRPMKRCSPSSRLVTNRSKRIKQSVTPGERRSEVGGRTGQARAEADGSRAIIRKHRTLTSNANVQFRCSHSALDVRRLPRRSVCGGGWTLDVLVKWSPLSTTVCKRSVPLSQKKASSRRRSGSFRLTHFRSIRNFWLTSSSLVTGCFVFQRACNQLYQLSVKGKQPGWIARYLDAGKQKN